MSYIQVVLTIVSRLYFWYNTLTLSIFTCKEICSSANPLQADVSEIKSKYHSFNQLFILLLTQISSFEDDVILRNTFYLILFEVVGWAWFLIQARDEPFNPPI